MFFTLASFLSIAEITRYNVKTVPDTEILNFSYVTDLSSVISPSVKDSINFYCRFAKDSLGAEIAVLTLIRGTIMLDWILLQYASGSNPSRP